MLEHVLNRLSRSGRLLPIGVIWLFNLSAIIGIQLGYEKWFIEKTPVNLTILLLALVLYYPLGNLKTWGVFLLIAVLGLTAEWIGVSEGVPFGKYSYGANFGPKFWGVPWLIGVFWAVLSMVSYSISRRLLKESVLSPLLAAALMLLLDLLMEQSAPRFDFWAFDGEPPAENFISWFALALIFQGILGSFRIRGDFLISLHIFLAQWVFFAFFWIF